MEKVFVLIHQGHWSDDSKGVLGVFYSRSAIQKFVDREYPGAKLDKTGDYEKLTHRHGTRNYEWLIVQEEQVIL